MDGSDIAFIILPLFWIACFALICFICWGFWKAQINSGVGGARAMPMGNGTWMGYGYGVDNRNTGINFGMSNRMGFGGMNDPVELGLATTTNRTDDDDTVYGWNLNSEVSPVGIGTGMDGFISGGMDMGASCSAMDMGTSGGNDTSCSGGGGGGDTGCSGGTDSGTCGTTD